MPGQTTRGDMVFTWIGVPAPYNDLRRVRPVVEATRDPDPRTVAMSKPFEGRAELELDRNHWKREALRYKQLLMDMLGKEVE